MIGVKVTSTPNLGYTTLPNEVQLLIMTKGGACPKGDLTIQETKIILLEIGKWILKLLYDDRPQFAFSSTSLQTCNPRI